MNLQARSLAISNIKFNITVSKASFNELSNEKFPGYVKEFGPVMHHFLLII